MSEYDEFDRSIARWFDAELRPAGTAGVLEGVLRATRRRRPRPRLFATLGSHWVGGDDGPVSGGVALGRTNVRPSMVLLLLVIAVVLVTGAVLLGSSRLQPAPDVPRPGLIVSSPGPEPTSEPTRAPSGDLGIFGPVAGRFVYGDAQGIWGVDPAASSPADTTVRLPSEPGTPLGWSSDGTRLLIMRGASSAADLFVLHADGSETQLTERPTAIRSGTISPDGSRVVFNDSGTMYSVNTDGGPVERVLESRYGSLRDPTFAPDGTQIAYVDGRGDWGHSVWIVDVDGSDARQVLANETTDGAGHASGLAWSPAGDRIALGLEGATFTFATDGSGFTRVITNGADPHWSPDGTQILYTDSCFQSPDGCGFGIADADGSNAREFRFGTSGPWHPSTDGLPFVFPGAGGLYVADADGGPAKLLVEARGTLRAPVVSPDGKHIVYADGAGDHSNSVWLVNVDGSDPHLIVSNEVTDGGGHVRGLAWSPAGDRIALWLDGRFYTFAPDGSGFTQEWWVAFPDWSPDGP